MWAKIFTIKRTKDLNYFSLCAFNLFNTRVAQFDLNYWNKWTFPQHSNLLRCTCNLWKCSIWLPLSKYRSLFTNDLLFAADTGLYLIWILLVLSSAFDTVDHNVLINYLKTCVGISANGTMDCVHQQCFLEVFLSPCCDLHYSSIPVCDAVPSKGPKITGIQYGFPALTLTQRACSRFSESLDDIMHCRW